MTLERTRRAVEDVAAIVGIVAPAVPAFVGAVQLVVGLFRHPPTKEDGTTWTPEQIRDRVASDFTLLYREASAERQAWNSWKTRTSE